MTIYALSTGPGISGVAIIRISGEQSSKIIETLTGKKVLLLLEFQPRVATFNLKKNQ
jgi:tRNA modification GTPase